MLGSSKRRRLGGVLYEIPSSEKFFDLLVQNDLTVMRDTLLEGDLSVLGHTHLRDTDIGTPEVSSALTLYGTVNLNGPIEIHGALDVFGTLTVGSEADPRKLDVWGGTNLYELAKFHKGVEFVGPHGGQKIRFTNDVVDQASIESGGGLEVSAVGLLTLSTDFSMEIKSPEVNFTTGNWSGETGAIELLSGDIELTAGSFQFTTEGDINFAGGATTFEIADFTVVSGLTTYDTAAYVITAAGDVTITAGLLVSPAAIEIISTLYATIECEGLMSIKSNIGEVRISSIIETKLSSLDIVRVQSDEGNVYITANDGAGRINLEGGVHINDEAIDDLKLRAPFKILAAPPSTAIGTVYLDNGTNTDNGKHNLRIAQSAGVFSDFLVGTVHPELRVTRVVFDQEATAPGLVAGTMYGDDGTNTLSFPRPRYYAFSQWHQLAYLVDTAKVFVSSATAPTTTQGTLYLDDGSGTETGNKGLRHAIGAGDAFRDVMYHGDVVTTLDATDINTTRLDVTRAVFDQEDTAPGLVAGTMYGDDGTNTLSFPRPRYYAFSQWHQLAYLVDTAKVFISSATAPTTIQGTLYLDDGSGTETGNRGLRHAIGAGDAFRDVMYHGDFVTTLNATDINTTRLDVDHIKLTENATAPTGSIGRLYYDDGSNTDSGLAGPRVYQSNSSVYADLGLYAQGTFTPAIGISSGLLLFGHTVQQGSWIRFGNAVFLQIFVAWNTRNSITGSLYLFGNPIEGNGAFTRQGFPIYLITLAAAKAANTTYQLQSANGTTRLTITKNTWSSTSGGYANFFGSETQNSGVLQAAGWWVSEPARWPT